VTTVLLDSHTLHWWAAEPERLSRKAGAAVSQADVLGVSGVTWYELAWLAQHRRIAVVVPSRTWLERLATHVVTFGVTPAIADTAAGLPSSFPGDPADRIIYATAIEHGLRLVTKDRRLRDHDHSRPVTIW
jgi:PIN domain nuclease of toxin-antitoxin system